MNQVIERGGSQIALRVSRDSNRKLLKELLASHEIVDISESVPHSADLCIVDDRGVSQIKNAITGWKDDQHPTYAPVLLLSETSGPNPWTQYASLLGEQVDAIQPIPAPRAAILTRIQSLLETREYSRELVSERQLVKQIFTTSPIAKTVLDTDGNIVQANQRAEDVLGLSKSEISGQSFDSPDWQPIDENGDPIPSEELPFSQVMASGEPVYGYEHGIERLDGDQVWLSINMGPILDESNEIAYLVSSIEDVTERKQLERELRQSEELHRATLSNITDTVFITDDKGRFTYVCPNVHFIFGYTDEEVLQMGSVEALLGEDSSSEGLTDDEAVENVELQITDAEGQEHTVLVTVNPVSIQEGTRLYSVRDVTELIESEHSLARERERLEAVVSKAPLILTVLDNDGTILLSMGQQLEHLGLETGELVGMSVADAFSGTPEIVANVRRTLEGEEFRAEVQLEDQYLEAWHQPVFENGDVDHAIIVAQDITDYKHQEERFRAFVEGSSDIIAVLDREGVVEYVSPSVERILGYDPNDLVGQNAFEIVHPEDREDLVDAFAALSDAVETTTITKRYRTEHVDGSWRWTESRATSEASPALGEIIVNTRDITDRVERERELEGIFDRVTDAFAAVDTQWRFTYVNERAEELLGATEEDLLGRTHWEAFPEVLGTTFEEEYRRAMDTQEPISFEEYYPPLETWFSVRAYPSESGLSIYFRDVTARKVSEHQLRRSQRAVEASGHAIYITDPDGVIEYVNPAFEHITGYTREDAIGNTPNILNAGGLPDQHFEELWTTIQSGDNWDEVVINKRKGGVQYHAAQTIAPIRTEGGEIEGFVAIQTDITHHKDRLQQLRVMDRVLRHNLHNDMNVVLGYGEMVQQEGEHPLSDYGEKIVERGNHLLNLTDKQRKITEILSTEPNLVAIDAVSTIRQIVETISAEHPNARLELDLPTEAIVSATDKLGQAVNELLMNAIKHTDEEPPSVGLRVIEDSDTIQIRVADTGPGIPNIEQEVVMGKQEIDPLHHGIGLGLWLVSWITRQANGSLHFEENQPRGTMAVLTFPKALTDDVALSVQQGSE